MFQYLPYITVEYQITAKRKKKDTLFDSLKLKYKQRKTDEYISIDN